MPHQMLLISRRMMRAASFALLIMLIYMASFAEAACSLTSQTNVPAVANPSGSGNAPIFLSVVSQRGDYIFFCVGATNNVVYKYTVASGTTTFMAGAFPPGSKTDGTGASGTFATVTAITYDPSSDSVYVIDSGSIRRVSSTGVVKTIITDGRIDSSTVFANVLGSTSLIIGSSGCVLTLDPAATTPALTVLAGVCGSSPATTAPSNSQSLTAALPAITAIANMGQKHICYSSTTGSTFLVDVNRNAVNSGPSISGTVSLVAPIDGNTVVFFTQASCSAFILQAAAGGPPTLTTVAATNPPSVCTTGRLVGAGLASQTTTGDFLLLFQGSSTSLVLANGCDKSSSSSTPTTGGASTTASPTAASSGGSSDSNTTTIIIAVVVSFVVIAIIVAVVICVVVKMRTDAETLSTSRKEEVERSTPANDPTRVDVADASGGGSNNGSLMMQSKAFDSLPKPRNGNPASPLGFSNSPGTSGGTVAATRDASGSYPPRPAGAAGGGAHDSISDQKRALVNSELQGSGMMLTAVSHSDFAQSGMEVSDVEIRRHNKRCEYVATGAYQKGRILGRGANGTVYAVLLKDGSTIAMKEVNLMGSEDEIRAQMNEMDSEVRLLRDLHHPNLVTYYGVQADNKSMQMRLFMENVTGGSLGAMVRSMDEPLGEATARFFSFQIVKGLAFIHGHGIIHRDLKCDNILRDSHTGLVKLADFGTAKSLGNAAGASKAAQTMIGTPYFMAPEILLSGMGELENGGYGIKADVWSLGITVAELLNRGVPPWPAFPSPGHAFLHISSPQGIPTMPDGLSVECQDFIRRCTDRNPATRPTSQELLLHPWFADIEE